MRTAKDPINCPEFEDEEWLKAKIDTTTISCTSTTIHWAVPTPRDALKNQRAVVSLHRILSRRATYGPMLPDGVLEDDGEDRVSIFVFIGGKLSRQFEFVKSQ